MSFFHSFAFIPQQMLGVSTWLLTVLIGVFGIGFLIGFHELGHFLFAKLFNIRTPSFSIGFGPRLISKKIGDTQFSLSAIPLGGYVELAGAAEVGQGEQKEAHDTGERSFATKPYYQKLLVMSGGILFNLLFAYIALFFLFMLGMPKSPYLYPLNASNIVESVKTDSPAEKAGLLAGDKITSLKIDAPIPLAHLTVTTENPSEFIRSIMAHPNTQASIEVEREDIRKEFELIIASEKGLSNPVGSIGIQFAMKEGQRLSFFDALKRSVQLTNLYIIGTFKAFKHIFTKRDVNGMGGPITIVSETVKGASKGFKMVLFFLAVISINLAILNLIPVPILDGGQILFYTIEALVGRSIPNRVREYIFIASWLAFLALILYLSYKDLLRVLPGLAKVFKR